MRIRASRIFLTAAPLAALALTACPPRQFCEGANCPTADDDVALRRFADCTELRGYLDEIVLEQLVQSRYTPYAYMEDDVADAEADGSSEGGDEPTDYTTTNVQEEGVDEIDIVKTDGTHIYAVEGESLHIVDSWPVEDAHKVATLELDGYARGLFLHEDQLIATSTFYDDTFERSYGGTRLSFIDVSDPAHPSVTRTVDLEGYVADARMIDDRAYFVLNTWLPLPEGAWDLVWDESLDLPDMDWQASEAEQQTIRDRAREILRPHVEELVDGLDLADVVPLYQDSSDDSDTPLPLHACDDVYRPSHPSYYSMMTVLQADLSDGTLESTGVLSDGWTVYASRDNLYVAQTSWWWWWGWGDLDLDTHIHKFSLEGDEPGYVASGIVDGWLLNQFAMSEYDGHLRVASTEQDWWWGTGADQGGNHVTVLRDDDAGTLEVVGQARDIAPGEQIRAVRMMGERGFVVTFEQIDPLFTLDLSEPEHPTVEGELELPGFSAYLHPLGDDHLLAVGMDGDLEGNLEGLAVTVFDVSDMSVPRVAHQYTLDADRWTWSEALWDHHAFTFHRDVLSIPIYTWDYDDTDESWSSFSGLLVLKVTSDEGISELGRIDHDDLVTMSECAYEWGCDDGWDGYWYAWMRRSVYIEDNLFSISNYGMKVNEIEHPEHQIAAVPYRPLE